jgi:AraC-like DNA-binding protein
VPRAFETSDPELAHEFLTQAYAENHMAINAVSGAMRLCHARHDAGLFYHDVYVNSMDVSFDTQPLGRLVIARVIEGQIERDVAGVSERLGPGDVYLVSEPHRPHFSRSSGVHLDLIGIGLALVADVAGDPALAVPGRLRLTGYRPVSPEAARTWNRTIDFVRDGFLANEETPASPLLAGGIARLLAASALATFPNHAAGEPDPAESRDAHTVTLQRAVAFIDGHAAQDISVADVAAAAFVTVRAVQLAFRRQLDTTPLEYLRRVRLKHAHADLLDADPSRESVTAVAYRWGFPSPGRFAAAYRQAYGVLPSATLRRG